MQMLQDFKVRLTILGNHIFKKSLNQVRKSINQETQVRMQRLSNLESIV